ncbi:MAG: type IV pilin [Salinirussus sp.]
MGRAQSHVVGVALLLGLTVIALGGLTVGIGTVVESQAASADASAVASGFDAALDATATHGHHTHRVTFARGRIETVERTLRIRRDGATVASRAVGGLVFESGRRRVGYVAGAVVRGHREDAWLVTEPPVTAADRPGVLVVGAPRIAADAGVAGTGGVTVAVSTNVSHARIDLGRGRFTVAVETATPDPLARYFERTNATVDRRDYDGDGVPSVVADYPGRRQAYLVVHDLGLAVTRSGGGGESDG